MKNWFHKRCETSEQRLPLFPHPAKVCETQQNLEHRRTRDSKPDVEEPTGRLAHDVCHGNSDQKSRGNALQHDKARAAEAVVEADEAEQEAGQQAVDSVGFQIVEAGSDDFTTSGSEEKAPQRRSP